MNSADLRAITAAGGGVIVSARHLNVADLRSIVTAGDGIKVVRDADSLNASDCRAIAAAGRGKVILDFVGESK